MKTLSPSTTRQRISLRLEELTDRITPATWTVNDPSDAHDANPKDNKPETANGTITLRSIFDYLSVKGGGGTINFNGPMDITGDFYYFKGSLTVNGIRQNEVPVVTIHGTLGLGSGNHVTDMQLVDSSGPGLYCQNNNVIKNNVMGNNAGYGICAAGSGNKITGNFVGVTAAGTAANPNQNGILLLKGNNTVGGTTSADANIVSGNLQNGIILPSSAHSVASNCVVIGNRIGTSKDGNTAIPNQLWGITVEGTSNRIGGTTNAERNQIVSSGGGLGGILVDKGSGPTMGNKIQGNFIGTKADGLSMFSDGQSDPTSVAGISIQASGGVTFTTVQKNTIVDALAGLKISGPGSLNGTLVVGNNIGVGFDKATILRNKDGVVLVNSDGVNLGQRDPANRNVISGNTENGIVLTGGAKNTKVYGNYIGTNASEEDLGNGLHGIYVEDGSKNFIGTTSISGAISGEINTLAFNGNKAKDIDPNLRGHAIQIDQGKQNTIRGNVFHDNAGLSIYLTDPNHVNELPQNDVAQTHSDPKTDLTVYDHTADQDDGPNRLQNYPVPMSIDVKNKLMLWRLDTDLAKTSYTIDFYTDEKVADLGYGQPHQFLVSKSLVTNAQGFGTVSIPWTAGQLISATATDPNGNTSVVSIVDSDTDGLADGWEKAGHGIDFDMNGQVDQPLMGADPMKKDIYLEADVMSSVYNSATVNSAFALVTQAFANAPDTVGNPGTGGGVNLHINPDMPADTVPTQAYPDQWAAFSNDKNTYFGHGLTNIQKEARQLAYRYTILAQSFRANNGVTGYSGIAELTEIADPANPGKFLTLGGNDFMVCVPSNWFQHAIPGMNTVTDKDIAGTLMHELGHTLGLQHGGTDEQNFKPNYQSVMSYNWQMPSMLYRFRQADADYSSSWSLDYSRNAQDKISELGLLEGSTKLNGMPGKFVPVGIAYGTGKVAQPFYAAPGSQFHVMPQTGQEFSVPQKYNDWLYNGQFDKFPITIDLNHNNHGDVFLGAEDWSRLIYNFRESPSSLAGQHGTEENELESLPAAGDPSGAVAKDSLIIGSDVGKDARVQVFAPDGTVTYDFNPFPGFTGGVRVAKGDVNGDGITDFIAVMGPAVAGTGGNTINVYDGTNGQLLYSAMPFGANFTGGINVAAGNTDGDANKTFEIIVAPASGTGSSIQVLTGSTGASIGTFTAYATNTIGGVTVASGDVNGDGKADIVTGMASGTNPMVRIFNGLDRKLLNSFTVSSKSYNGVNLTVADFNGDGKADIVTAAGGGTATGLRPEIRVYDGSNTANVLFSFITDDITFKGGIRVSSVQMLDGNYSLLTSTGAGKQPVFRRFGPLSYQSNWEKTLFDNTYSGAFVG